MTNDELTWTIKIGSRPKTQVFSRQELVGLLQDYLDEHDGNRQVLNEVRIHQLSEQAAIAQPRHWSDFIS